MDFILESLLSKDMEAKGEETHMHGNKKIILGCLSAIAILCTVLIIKGSGEGENIYTTTVENQVIPQEGTVSAVQKEETIAAISSSGSREAAVSSAAIRKKGDTKKKVSVKRNNDHKIEPKSTKEPDKKSDKKTDKKTVDPSSTKTKSPKKNTGSKPKPQSTKSPKKNPQVITTAPSSSPAAASATLQEKNECSLTITCQEVFSHLDKLNESAKKVIPEDGIILKGNFAFEEGETVFDVLKRVCKEKEIHLDYVFTPLYSTYYIKGIHNLYEFDCGDESGWMYSVNGKDPGCGSNKYKLVKGDQVVFNYTCEY